MPDGVLMLRAAAWKYRLDVEEFAHNRFSDVVAERGSIGLTFARLWKQEVAAVLLLPSYETPWDSAPILGISRKLGFVCVRMDTREEIELHPPHEPAPRDYEMLVIHRAHLANILG